jgi:hypothetical protein
MPAQAYAPVQVRATVQAPVLATSLLLSCPFKTAHTFIRWTRPDWTGRQELDVCVHLVSTLVSSLSNHLPTALWRGEERRVCRGDGPMRRHRLRPAVPKPHSIASGTARPGLRGKGEDAGDSESEWSGVHLQDHDSYRPIRCDPSLEGVCRQAIYTPCTRLERSHVLSSAT